MAAVCILAFMLLFSSLDIYAGGEKISWGDPGYANEFKYLLEKNPGIRKTWDEQDGDRQESGLTGVREAADERLEQVQVRYKLLAARWDLAAAQANWDSLAPADVEAFRLWLGEEQSWWFREKVSALRDAVAKARMQGLTEADALALQPYVQQDVINALKQSRSLEVSQKNGNTGDYLKNTRSAAGLGDLAAKKPGAAGRNDLARFYDGSAAAGGPAEELNGAGAAALGGNMILAPEKRGTAAGTIKHSAPAALEGGEETGGSAAAAQAGKSGKGRPLSDAELAAARGIYGDKIDYSKVRIVSGGDMTLWGKVLTRGGAAVTWGNTIYFPNDENNKTLYDPGRYSDWYVHEMGHVYQYQKDGWGYVPRSVWEQLTGDDAYGYQIEPGKDFGKYGVEQQARIIQDYYRGAITPSLRPEVEKMLRKEGLLGGS